jgi:hypothetical protein
MRWKEACYWRAGVMGDGRALRCDAGGAVDPSGFHSSSTPQPRRALGVELGSFPVNVLTPE